MTEVHQLPDSVKVEREASAWLARLNADDVSSKEREKFAAWHSAHPLHARVYSELSAVWQAFAAAAPVVQAVSFGQSMNEAAQAQIPPRRKWPFAAAAVMVLAALVSWYFLGRTPETFQTAVGEHAAISLPDGSILELNSNSLARVEYSDHTRVIRLERGEGFFKVMHDTSRPFWVAGHGSWVRAVGTEFDVNLRPEMVRVTVTEGTVKVVNAEPLASAVPSDEVLARIAVSVLTAGQQADLHGSATAIRALEPDEINRSDSWRNGTLDFEGQPLIEVVEELGRYTTLQLIVSDAHLRQLIVGGTFHANPQGAEAFLNTLRDGFGLRIRREPGRVYIERAGPRTLKHNPAG